MYAYTALRTGTAYPVVSVILPGYAKVVRIQRTSITEKLKPWGNELIDQTNCYSASLERGGSERQRNKAVSERRRYWPASWFGTTEVYRDSVLMVAMIRQ